MSAVLTLTHDEMAIRAATRMRDSGADGKLTLGGGFRLLKRFGGSYYLKEFGLVPDWPKVNEIMTKQLW